MITHEMIITTICAIFRAKVRTVVENDDYEGWDGVINVRGRDFQLSITEIKHDK